MLQNNQKFHLNSIVFLFLFIYLFISRAAALPEAAHKVAMKELKVFFITLY